MTALLWEADLGEEWGGLLDAVEIVDGWEEEDADADALAVERAEEFYGFFDYTDAEPVCAAEPEPDAWSPSALASLARAAVAERLAELPARPRVVLALDELVAGAWLPLPDAAGTPAQLLEDGDPQIDEAVALLATGIETSTTWTDARGTWRLRVSAPDTDTDTDTDQARHAAIDGGAA